jgi:nicotinamide-nucleotide amidase
MDTQDAVVAGAAQRASRALVNRGETLALVETSGGGVASAALTAIVGSSAWFLGGVVAYSALARERWLGLTPAQLGAAGVVSGETALALARAARESLGATWGAAETGIAGPQTGRRSAKPVGLAYVAISGGRGDHLVERVVEVRAGRDDRAFNQRFFAAAVLDLISVELRDPS